MKKLLTMLCGAALVVSGAEKVASDGPIFSSTIDFLDYAFYDKIGAPDRLTLEAYEQRIREMAEGGLAKIYLRVNANGLTIYPTSLSKQYGTDGDYHWFDVRGARRFIATLKEYDPVAETIRLGHKYGMEVWCWESVFDDSSGPMTPPDAALDPEAAARTFSYPLMDPYYREHPEGYAQLNPRLDLSDEQLEQINREAMEYPIGRIVVTNRVKGRPPVRFDGGDLEILTSADNRVYRPYAGKFVFRSGVTDDGRNFIEIDQLNITDPYVKLQLSKSFPGSDRDSGYTIAANAARGLCEVYNVRGRKVSSVWATVLDSKRNPNVPFNFAVFNSAGFDSFGNRRQIGFKLGEVPRQRYFYGVAEFNVPESLEYRVRRFRELAAYPFDGYMMNLRTHSRYPNPGDYGYNPEVREKFLQRYGLDIWKDKFDKRKLFELRAEGVAEYLRRCKAEIGGRPLYISGVPQPTADGKAAVNYYARMFGPLPWLYSRYIADGSIDGIMLLGCDKVEDIGLSAEDAAKVKIGVFREMAFPPANYNYVEDMRRLRQREDIDEVELYETMVLTGKPEMFNEIKNVKGSDGK